MQATQQPYAQTADAVATAKELEAPMNTSPKALNKSRKSLNSCQDGSTLDDEASYEEVMPGQQQQQQQQPTGHSCEEKKEAASPELHADFEPSSLSDDYRSPQGHSDGGFALTDKSVISKFRGAFKSLVAQIGSQIMKGEFNLTTVSLPIKAMDHNSILQAMSTMGNVSSYYYTLAALTEDPIERMKMVVTASIAYLEPTHHWNKPLNPIIGETYQAESPDGSSYFLEQVSHHPPIAYFVHYGPQDIFRFSSYAQLAVHAHFNSIDMQVNGSKKIEFLRDGTSIVFDQHSDAFKNTIFGTLSHQIRGTVTYTDHHNGIQAEIKHGGIKKKAKDYFTGVIRHRAANQTDKWHDLVQVKGTYLGWIEFDGIRYWDLRQTRLQEVQGVPFPATPDSTFVLPSDSRLRMDSIELEQGNVEQAQLNKNALEQRQRNDTALRKAAEQRRAQNGPKIVLRYKK